VASLEAGAALVVDVRAVQSVMVGILSFADVTAELFFDLYQAVDVLVASFVTLSALHRFVFLPLGL